jgi:hypothetical protein
MWAGVALLFGSLVARAYDTSWISSGQTVSAASLKGNLDESQSRISALETSVSALTSATKWTAFTPATGWAARDQGTWNTPAYFKDAMGMVHMKGLLGGPVPSAIVTLPAGFRPLARYTFFLPAHFDNNNTDGLVRVDISANGDVSTVELAVGTGNLYWLSLDSISFRAEQ